MKAVTFHGKRDVRVLQKKEDGPIKVVLEP
jgi:hypothetical protein